jgi:MarR family transcriptional regulator, negative regulator of the multidrug operon emrRAB
MVLALADDVRAGTVSAARHGANGPAALVSLLWYPGRTVGFLAERLRISHPGAVQLAGRLERDGLVRRTDGLDGRTRLLALTARGSATARAVLAERSAVLDRALVQLDDAQVRALQLASAAILEDLAEDVPTSEFLCRLCDEASCPDAHCPVERAVPTPPGRRGAGYGAGD